MINRKFMLIAITTALILTFSTGTNLSAPLKVSAQDTLYTSCEADKLTAPLGSDAATEAAPTETATDTAEVTSAGDTSAGGDNIVFLSIVGSESEACYLASEVFLENNMMNIPAGFNGPVGITKTITGDIAIDLNNLANSQIGDITINISEFKSDNDRRDGFIRRQFLESNKYPFAMLKNATISGLPSTAYTEGETLNFQIKGTLNVHDTDRETTFDVTGTYKDNVLVVKATTDLKMSEVGVQPPELPGFLRVDDAVRLVVNLVARPSEGAATPQP
jgi:polyisoprenoid-binding protein YceI